MNVKNAQVTLQNTITWTKKSKKGDRNQRRLELIMGCSIGNLRPLSKTYFHPKSLSSSSIMGEKNLSFYEKEYIRFMWVIA